MSLDGSPTFDRASEAGKIVAANKAEIDAELKQVAGNIMRMLGELAE